MYKYWNNSNIKYQNRRKWQTGYPLTHKWIPAQWLGTGTSIKSGEVELIL